MSASEGLTCWSPSNCRFCNKPARHALVCRGRASNQDDDLPRSKEFLLEQIARAKRFARAMNTDADRERFEKMAADYRRELDAAEAEGQSSASPTASGDAVPTDDAVSPSRRRATLMRLRRPPVRRTTRTRRRTSLPEEHYRHDVFDSLDHRPPFEYGACSG
jgi:hypothetical protein